MWQAKLTFLKLNIVLLHKSGDQRKPHEKSPWTRQSKFVGSVFAVPFHPLIYSLTGPNFMRRGVNRVLWRQSISGPEKAAKTDVQLAPQVM
jgi:hypothetical protein